MSSVTDILTPQQAEALEARARRRNTDLDEEIRRAVECYLAGITPEELELLDHASRQAESSLASMLKTLDTVNQKAATVFSELEVRERERKARKQARDLNPRSERDRSVFGTVTAGATGAAGSTADDGGTRADTDHTGGASRAR